MSEQNDSDDGFEAQVYEVEQKRQIIRQKLSRMELEQEVIEIEVEESSASFMEIFSGSGVEEMGINLQDLFGSMIPKKRKKRRVTVEEAKKIFTHE